MKTTILNTPYHLSLLAQLGHPRTRQPQISLFLKALYESMFSYVVSAELEAESAQVKTRMGIYKGITFKKNQKVVVVDIIRAGIEPAAIFYHKLTEIINPVYVRQDHMMSQRVETGKAVKEAILMSSKIGGSVKESMVFLPDPMGATGHSMRQIMEYYIKHHGQPKCFVAVNLVITTEYLDQLMNISAPVHVYAARQDNKLTPDSYIVPGLGGMGELINNTKQ